MKNVIWMKNDKILPIKDSEKFASFQQGDNSPTLMIMDVSKEDEGDYYFIAKNGKTEVKSISRRFEIEKELPKITIQNPIKDGKFTIIYVVIEKTTWPVKNLIWEKDGIFLSREKKFVNANEICTSRLRLSDVRDAGLYKVIAESVAGRSEAEKRVLEEEIRIPVHPILNIAVDKCQKKLKLDAAFETAAEMSNCIWMKNERKLSTKHDGKYQQSVITDKKCELVVNNVSKNDEGAYKLIVTSDFGSEESNVAVFKIEKEPPKILDFKKKEDKSTITLYAVFESEWPVERIAWYRNGKELNPSQVYSMHVDGHRCNLKIKDSEKSGKYTVELGSVAGTVRGHDIQIIEQCEMKNENTKAGCPAVIKTTGSILLPVMSPYKGSSDCEFCDYTAVAKVRDCGHHFCWKCLEVLADGPSSENIIDCLSDCPSWLTQRTIQNFIHDDENSKRQTSLYFKLDAEGYTCCALRCSNKGFIKLVYCNHTYCVDCIKNFHGNNICVLNQLNCEGNPPPIIFKHLQESLTITTVNPFLVQRHDKKCDVCDKKVVFQIFRCGHNFCNNCIQEALLPEREQQPFNFGKCLKEQCQEYFKFPWMSPTKKTEPATNKYESKGQEIDPESSRRDNISTVTDNGVQELQENQQILSAKKRKQKTKDDSSKKQKKVVDRYQKSFGLSNVGLSCYRNTILQTLAETPSFFWMLEPYKEKAAWIGLLSIILERIRAQNTYGQEMVDYLQHFHYEFNEKHSEYREFQQEDTLSFLTSILNGVQEELKTLEKCKDRVERLGDPASLFRGTLKDRYFCKSCKKEEFFEGESFFSLPLPVTESLRRKGKVTLGSCIRGFLSKEDIDGIPCSFCGSNEITKEIMIETFPDVLVLQICKLEEASNSTFQRNRSHVDFWETFEGLKVGTKEGKELKEALKHYRLFSVVEHIGSERSGHYICYVKRHGNQIWNLCDDSYVKEVKLEEVRKCDAYLFFYEKCGSDVDKDSQDTRSTSKLQLPEKKRF